MNEATPLADREKEAQLAHSTLASDMSSVAVADPQREASCQLTAAAWVDPDETSIRTSQSPTKSREVIKQFLKPQSSAVVHCTTDDFNSLTKNMFTIPN